MSLRVVRHLEWNLARGSRLETLGLDIALPARERAIYLLHVGAEVEHALMVQYLYAAYSLGGPHLKQPALRKKVMGWRSVITEIARQEMGHLATIQNILTLIGGPLSFERQDYPFPDTRVMQNDHITLYPFPFELERLTKKSLGKYVLAEMPSEENIRTLEEAGKIEPGEIDEIKKVVGVNRVWRPFRVHRVGLIYQMIRQLFQVGKAGDQFISSADISAASQPFQVQFSTWGLGYNDTIIVAPNDRDSAIKALSSIDSQGEGFETSEFSASHFGRFLQIYRDFPAHKQWDPSKGVARNPTTNSYAPKARQITDKQTLVWAKLFNTRYWMLLMLLSHSFAAQAASGSKSTQGLLISWAFGEMYNLRSISDIIMTLPQHNHADSPLAGPPFEMPYSLSLPQQEVDRWRRHRDLLQASQGYVDELKSRQTDQKKYLSGLTTVDQEALAQIDLLISGGL